LAEITPVSFGSTHEEAVQEKYCDSSGCVI
jgi:hypothetical protein